MKKSVLFAILVLFLIAIFPLVLSDSINTTASTNGFACLSKQVGSCSTLSTQQEIFTSLASGQCTSQLQQSASNLGCWPSSSCNIPTTAQAILALHNSEISVNQSLSWLSQQGQMQASDLNWFLEIGTTSNATCTITYNNNPYTINIAQGGRLSGGAGSCLALAQNNYWLQISCFNTNFSISCNQQFTTTNLYQRQNFPTLYISSASSNSANSGAAVTDSVNPLCFGLSGCDYDSTLWGSLALSTLGVNPTPYLPYLITHAQDAQNQNLLPNAFLYALTDSNNYLQMLLSQQDSVNNQNYWQVSGDPYFDTALALLPLQNQNSEQKTNAIDWITGSQSSDGCWNSDNIVDTAFTLYSVWGTQATPSQNLLNCLASGYSCLPGLTCTQGGGTILNDYCSSGINVCCSKNQTIPSCASQQGTLCNSSLVCQTGSQVPSSDSASGSGEICCLNGCTQPTTIIDNCTPSQGTCRVSCLSNEQSSQQSCGISGEICCMAQPSSGYGWIILLSVLIILVLLGIIFRNKLRTFWLKLKSGFGGKGKSGPSMLPRGPPRPPYPPMNFQRRPQPLPIPRPQVRQQQKPSELNDVLKKLKEIGK